MSDDLLAALQAALDDVQDAFADAPAGGSIYVPPPDDDYEALIHTFEFLEGDWGVGLKVNYQIAAGTYSGRVTGDMFGITPDRIQYLKGFLSTLGVDVNDPAVLQQLRPGSELLNGLLDTPVLIRVKSKGGVDKEGHAKTYTNVYLQRKLGEPGSNGQGFTPRSDVTTQQSFQDFQPVSRGQNAVDDDIPF